MAVETSMNCGRGDVYAKSEASQRAFALNTRGDTMMRDQIYVFPRPSKNESLGLKQIAICRDRYLARNVGECSFGLEISMAGINHLLDPTLTIFEFGYEFVQGEIDSCRAKCLFIGGRINND